MLDRPLPKDLVQAARAISDASSIKSSQSKGATLAQSQVPLTFHCLSLPFHCLSSPSHCLSLPSHCRYIDPSLTSPQAGSPVRKMDKELYAAILLYTGNSIYAALNKVLRNEDRMSRPCPCPCLSGVLRMLHGSVHGQAGLPRSTSTTCGCSWRRWTTCRPKIGRCGAAYQSIYSTNTSQAV